MDPSTECLSFNLNLHPSAQVSTQQLSEYEFEQERNLDQQQFKNQEGGNWMEVISRIDRESKRMTQMVADMFDKCSAMHHQLMDLMIKSNPKSNNHGDGDGDTNLQIRKRKAEHLDDHIEHDYNGHLLEMNNCVADGNCSCKRIRMINCKPKITTTFFRLDSSDTCSLVVKDGYQWRKYGQKVTRDNPSPRAYFKCSFAPICPVKKKVQKSVEDPTVLVATYEGEHNHKKPCGVGSLITTTSSTNIINPSSLINLSPSSHISSPSTLTLDRLVHQNFRDSSSNDKGRGSGNEEENEDEARRPLEHWLVEQMASSLTKDPSFTSTLAAAISDKVLDRTNNFCN